MSSGIVEEPGYDTKVQQFTPIRNAPVWRRAVRQYRCLEDVANTSDFTRLQFKVHCQEKNLVCSDARLVFPLELTCYNKDPEDVDADSQILSMATNDAGAACNIAVAQNSPWNAFETVNTVVNTKVYTEKPRSYGRTLSNCYQSVSEMSFMNNHSLKPIANTDFGAHLSRIREIPVRDDDNELTGATVTVSEPSRKPSRFVLENANSGFLERSRQFQDGLNDSGRLWRGEISSLLNCGPFSAESRGQGNDQIPYIEDLFLNVVFKQTKCALDASLVPSRGPDYRKVIVQDLFEFLTPSTASLYRQAVDPVQTFPTHYQLRWTGRPYIQIEWLSYNPAAMLPMYRLQGFQYKLTKSNEFTLPFSKRLDERAVVTPRVSTQCLSVPNKLYVWCELSETSARDSFLFGGAFRTCEIMNKSLMVRVNGESHIIDRPDAQSMLFKWWKRHSNSVAEYPTWSKCQVLILTPNEIGLANWLENDAVLSTVEISCDVRLSKLQHIEYNAAIQEDGLLQAGVHESIHNATSEDHIVVNGTKQKVYLSGLFGQQQMGRSNYLTFTMQLYNSSDSAHVFDEISPPYIPSTKEQAGDLLPDYYLSHIRSPEKVRVHQVRRCLMRLQNSVWVKYNTSTKEFVSTLFFVPETHLFEFQQFNGEYNSDEREGFVFCPWFVIDDYDEDFVPIIASDGTDGNFDLSSYLIKAKTYTENNLYDIHSLFNRPVTMPGGMATNTQKGACPGPQAKALEERAHTSQGIILQSLLHEKPYFDNDMFPDTSVNEFTTIWGEDPEDVSGGAPTDIRWVCMQPVAHGAANSEFYTSWDDEDGLDQYDTNLHGYYNCNVYRGQKNTPIVDSDFTSHNSNAGIKAYKVSHNSQDSAKKHFKYELNVLAEYSNEQIVMDANRRQAVQIENLVPVPR